MTDSPATELERAPLQRRPLIALSLGYFLVMLDITVVNVALPDIQASLRAGSTDLQWIVDGYSTVFAGFLLVGGGLGDRLGHRRIFLGGLSLFVLASAWCALAGTAATLIAGRLAQGAGSALLVPASFALLQTAYPGRVERARAVGLWGLVAAVAFGAGPAVGGLLVSGLSWRWVFWVNIPIALLAIRLTVRHVPAPAATTKARRMDPLGQVLGVSGLIALTGGLNLAGAHGWTSSAVLATFAVALAALTAFALNEHRLEGRHPLLPLSLFRRLAFTTTTLVGLLLSMGYYGLLFLLSLYFRQQRHDSALITGMALLPSVVMGFVAAPLSSRLTARFGPFLPMAGALLLGSVGFLGWLTAGPHTAYPVLLFALTATGLATPMTVIAATVAVLESVGTNRAGVGSAVFNVARQVGNAVGVALFGTLTATSVTWMHGLHLSAVIASAAFLTAAAAALLASGLRRAVIGGG